VSFFQRVIVFLTQFTVFMLSVKFIADGTISVGELVALNGYALMFFGPFVSLGHSWQTIQNGLTSAGQLERIFLEKEEIYHPEHATPLPEAKGHVVFNNVSLRYAPESPEVLSGISFSAHPGEKVAIVGESGVGKSTIMSLVSGYYFPSSGELRVDGVVTPEWDLTELRTRIAIVPQEIALFNDTIGTNIRYGTFKASEDAIVGAAKEAHIDEFIQTLPKKYDTLVGERGIKLSVGQKQRIAIARAILRNPSILILDEPTSALDSQTEQYINASLEKLMVGRTTFIIAHRLSTVRKADKILVVKEGKVVEAGKHNELMQIENGVYRNLYELHIGLHE
jgi:subfamily B ATP-binding cassette protein MsbA